MPEGSHPALHQGPMGEESPQLSSPLSGCDHVPDSCAQVCMEPLDSEGERPVSLVSTLSSGSSRDSSSLSVSTAALLASTTPPIPSEEDIDLELVPAEETREHCGNRSPILTSSMGRFQKLQRNKVNLWNNNNGTTDREIRHILSSPVIRGTMAPNPKLTYLDRVVMEINETERTYVRDLRSIVEDYLACIIDMNNLPIRPEQVCALFGNIEDIYEFNSELLQSLDMCENDPVAIAQCFVNKSEYFEIYTQYCTNYPNSVAALTDCMRSKTLAKFFRDRQAALKHSLPLGSYLLKPVQRILKYHLLLQEIAKHFDPDEKGYEVIQEAMNTMTGVAWYINDMKRKHEHAVRVQEIQSLLINWKGSDLTTYGELVLEGTFHVLRAKNTRTLFLFDKMLLITKKRGEHYVYKTHISCSTLMLLDSAKDPLLFSVIHFKHPKQPHTVQAKTVEEKRLWSHHIKRLILENHNAVVPQRAKEAILDTSNYPGKYQYSPERLKRAESNHNDEFHLGRRNGRRRSEPVKELIGAKAVLKHADSEGALLEQRCSLQPATSVDTLTSGLGEPLAPRLCEEDLFPRGESLEKQSPAAGGDGDELNLCSSLVEMEEGYKEDILPGDEQVADFATSVLAAISCWHYRARALLSTHFTTDEQSSDAAEEKTTSSEEAECLSLEGKDDDGAVEEPINQQDSPPPDSVLQSKECSHQYPDSPVTPSESNTETTELEHDTSNETAEEAVSDSSGLHTEEASVLTNSELSEDDEVLSDAKGRLSSSELDQASITAENFVEGTLSRRSSLVSEDLGRVSCSSPEDNYAFQIISTCTDSEKCSQTLQPVPDLSPSVQEPALNDIIAEERRSTLSKQDRLLIHKIRKYYEHAEYQDANFSIKRRESLSYIPAGLVRNLSRQLNSTPQEKPVPVHRKELSRSRPTSWSVFDLPGLERSQNAETCQKSPAKPRSCSMTDTLNTDEEFRPSSDMLKVWQDMEIEEENREGQQEVRDMNLEVMQDISLDSSEVKSSEPLSPVLEEPGCVTSTDGRLPPITTIPGAGYESATDSTPSKIASSQDESNVNHNHTPNVISARTSTDEDQILQDMGKMRNKVFQLARQYSQRIKNNRPIVWSRTREAANQQGLRGLPAVHEEKTQRRKKGKPNLRLPLTTCDQAVIHEVDFPIPVQTSGSGSSTDGTITSPQSPVSESFHWPDVQELRSKYTGTCLSSTVTRSHTVPSGMLEFCSEQCADKYLGFSDLSQITADCSVKQEDCPTDQKLLCTWSSLDHVLGSLPLLEVQNLQEPGTNSKHQDRNSLHYEGINGSPKAAVLSSEKSSESNLVKSLRHKFMNK
ncbi:pleckstrin homology domain-containing family G member 3-like isoform X2 [Gouania willdenowi]|uniref:pleckstrin homology domain-containing family G member 3-like isoform X2 n=1 Tax=Gouania willdenowi TaxID=441366 RepID=UPI001054AA7E|nr:pleckstrin homology domain-containing family G member 3-like isoform X2 [Gouania willdenowi]